MSKNKKLLSFRIPKIRDEKSPIRKTTTYKGFLANAQNDKKIGIIFGTFDIVHPGHLNLFAQARESDVYLITVIARDKTVFQVKGKYPKNEELDRLKNVKKHKVSDLVVLGSLRDKYAVIKKYRPDIIFLGYDQSAFIENLKSKLHEMNLTKAKIVRLKPHQPEIYKTSKMI